MTKSTKLAWDRVFKKEGKIFVKPEKCVRKAVKFFKKGGVKRILDLGCGSGRHLIYLAKRGFDVYGFDISKQGIKIAREWFKEEKLKANLRIGDFYKKLPFKDNFFDAIISIAALHHGKIGDIRKLIKEMKRVLKPQGLIFITAHKMLPKKKIPKEKLFEIKYIAPRTYIILGGPEKGGIHYNFNKKILKREFRDFEFLKLWLEPGHYCLLGKLKNHGN